MPTYGETPSTLDTPHHAPRVATQATHVRMCFPAAVVGYIEPISISDATGALPSVTMVLVRVRMSCMYIGGVVQADTCVAREVTRVVGCGRWVSPKLGHSCRGHGVELSRALAKKRQKKKR